MATRTGKSRGRAFDADIEEHLRDAYFNAIRKTDEYRLGRIEAHLESQQNRFMAAKEKIGPASEAFYHMAKRTLPDLRVMQHRIGLDYSSTAPAVLMVISPEQGQYLPTLREMARALELLAWRQSGCNGYIWTKTDTGLDQNLIDRDFPYSRVNV